MFTVDRPIVLDPYPDNLEIKAAQVQAYIESRNRDLGPVPVPVAYRAMSSSTYVKQWAITAIGVARYFRIDPTGFVAQIMHETNVLRFGNDVHPDQLNFGGLGATGDGVPGHSFPTIVQGLTASAEHLLVYAVGTRDRWPVRLPVYVDPRYQAVIGAGWAGISPTWAGLAGRWAEHIGTYKKGIERHANAIISQEVSGGETLLKIAIAAGHHNAQGGNPVEQEVVSEITERMFYHFNRTPGIECRSLTPDGPDDDELPGDGYHEERIYAMWSQTLARWATEGWVPDLCIEEHTQGVTNPDVRGFFGIHPSMSDDVDVDVRDRLIPLVCVGVEDDSAFPIWSDGVMAEHETSVGSGGDRLGYFLATAYLAATAERVLFENGAHTSPQDLELLRDPQKVDELCQSKVNSICIYYNLEYTWEHTAPPSDERIYFPETEKSITGAGFKARWRELSSGMYNYKHVGLPVSDEFLCPLPHPVDRFDTRIRPVQIFEKDVWVYLSDAGDDPQWSVQSVNQNERDFILAYARLTGIDLFGG